MILDIILTRCLIYIFSYDLWFYISHIILHKKIFYNSIHYIHHITHYKKMTYKDTYKSHYLETIVQSIGIFLPIMFMKFIYLEFIFVLILINIRGMIRHDFNLQWIFGNHHILHHQYGNCNYGEYYLDYIFNTNFTKEKRKL